jgi:hypothetical protein
MPYPAPPVADEREAFATYLAQHQLYVRATLTGLPDNLAGRRPLASALTLGTLVKHLTVVQDNWLAAVLAAPALATRWTDDDAAARWTAALTWRADDTVAGALAAFDASSNAVLDAAHTVDPDLAVPVHRAPWTPRDVPSWSVRWVWWHLVGELARHAGHGDLIREQLDGSLSHRLLALTEQEPA